MLYKGYIETKGKAAVEKFKNKTRFKTYEQVRNLPGFGGVLENDTILIDIDDYEQSEIMMDIVEDYQLDCRVYQTTRGKHFLFKNHQVTRNHTHVPLAIGLTADIKCGTRTSYEVIKINGEERFIEWDIEEGGTYQELPKWMLPVKAATDFIDMDAGDGRNQALFNYILTLTANGFTVDETREAIRILNKYVLKESLSDEELEVILTFISCIRTILGEANTSALDLKELGDRFSTSMIFGKLANLGDDIGDDFLQGSQVAVFKKIVTGDRIKAERKGQDPFEFNPYTKLLFSANDIPRMKDKTGAVLRRLVIIPFNARFSKYLEDGVTIDPIRSYSM